MDKSTFILKKRGKQNIFYVPSISCGILYLCIIKVTETFSLLVSCDSIQLKGAALACATSLAFEK